MPLTVFAGPNSGSSAGAPVFRSLDTEDIPDLSAGKITSGILPVSRGGTGLSASPTSGQILIGNGSGYNVGSLVAATNITVGNGTGAITISATADANKVTKAGDTMTGTLTLPSDGLLAGGSQLVLAGGNVGIGTSTPNATLDVNGSVTVRGTLSVSNNRITNVATPTASTDAATKAYVDAATAGVQWMGYTAAYDGTLGGAYCREAAG